MTAFGTIRSLVHNKQPYWQLQAAWWLLHMDHPDVYEYGLGFGFTVTSLETRDASLGEKLGTIRPHCITWEADDDISEQTTCFLCSYDLILQRGNRRHVLRMGEAFESVDALVTHCKPVFDKRYTLLFPFTDEHVTEAVQAYSKAFHAYTYGQGNNAMSLYLRDRTRPTPVLRAKVFNNGKARHLRTGPGGWYVKGVANYPAPAKIILLVPPESTPSSSS